MPTTLLVRFPLGRYHATPWGRHVNEGAVEIPPSPWRLLRALYAVWQTRAPELAEADVLALLGFLAEPPLFHVPRHITAHSRHYFPDSRDGTNRTLDAFAVIDPTVPLAVEWTRDLAAGLRPVLHRLAASLPYLGRADSICQAEVVDGFAPGAEHSTWAEVGVADEIPIDAVATAVLAPELPLRPETLLARPVDVRRGGLLFPQGSRFVGYQQVSTPRPDVPARPQIGTVTAIRFSVMQTACPPDTDAVVYTDILHRAAVHQLGPNRAPGTASQLAGRDVDGERMSAHGHAHFLPMLHERRLTELLIWVPAGLDAAETRAAVAVRRLYSPIDARWKLALRASGRGRIEDIAPEYVGPAHRWRSVTPFVPSRRPGRRDWGEFLTEEITRELSYRHLPAPVTVRPAPDQNWREFVRHRPTQRSVQDSRRNHSGRAGVHLDLTFDEPVAGPLALGYLAHYGLGLFAPTA